MADEVALRQVLANELSRIERMLDHHNLDVLESIQIRLERMYSQLIYINGIGLVASVLTDEFLDMVRALLNIIVSICEDPEQEVYGSNLTSVVSCRRGRPKYDLPEEQLVYFLDHGFTCTRISSMMGVSLRTVRRRMSEYQLCVRDTYSTVSDMELKQLLREALDAFPNSGYRFVLAWLQQKGYRVQKHRVRHLLREVDPIGVTNRFFRSIRRRTYCVPSPQALWHIDGNHKLIRSGLVYIHVWVG